MPKKITTKEFIEIATLIHGGRYDYSKVNYVNAHTKITIICPEHGEFTQAPNNHKFGFGCIKCGFNRTGNSQKINHNELLEQFKKIHGNKYDYSKIEYLGDNKKVIIICPEHGEFKQTPSNHKRGEGCSKCSNKYIPTNEEIIEIFKKVHGDKYDYSKIEYLSMHKKVKIICPIHGEFMQNPNSHKRGQGCPICNESKGELEIRNILNKNNIKFISQYKFNNCKYKKSLIFDFYLPNYNVCIEFNGVQHYKPVEYFGGLMSFLMQKEKDKIKAEYCQENNIPLFIINYNDNLTNKINRIITTLS